MIPMKQTPLGELATVSAGQGAPKANEFSDNGIPFVRAGSLDALLSGKKESDLELVCDETARLRKLKIYPKGTILFAKSGMSATKGRIYSLQSPAYVVSHLATLIPNGNAHAAYLRLALKSFPPSVLIKDPVYPAISLGDIQGYEIPVPEHFDDQIRIAHLLGKVEALVAQRKQHLQQLDDLLKSVFLEMFGDPARNEKGWEKFPISQIVEEARNGLSPAKGGEFKGRVYTLSAVTGAVFREIYKEDTFSKLDESYIPTMRDFLVCRGNGNIKLVGKAHFYPGRRKDVMFPDTVIALTIREGAINSKFLEALWKTNFIRTQIESAARTANGTYKINQKTLGQIEILYPSQEKQCDFETVATVIERLGAGFQKSLADLESLYGALSQQAFKGELDLSRIPLPTKPNDGEPLAVEVIQAKAKEIAINLPGADNLLDGLQSQSAREVLITLWLEAYRDQLGDTPSSIQRFMVAAQTRLAELYPDDDYELGAKDYEHIKTWVFEALADGRLIQSRNITGHNEKGEPVFGNHIQLKAQQV